MQVVVNATASTNDLVLYKDVDQATAIPGDVLNYELGLANFNSGETTFYLRDLLPTNLTYVADSVSSNASYNAVENQIEAQITLDAPVPIVEPFNWGGFFDVTFAKAIDLDEFCAGECDDAAINLNGIGLYYFGTYYSRIGISSNGFLQPGGATSATGSSQLLPNPADPNNVIAPLWTDLNLDEGGDWFYAFLSGGGNYYDVFQWTDVPQYGTTDLYTFQIWLVYGTDVMFFSYDSFPAGVATYDTTIGIEDPTGNVGSTFYNVSDGVVTGTLPDLMSATPDLIASSILDSATVTYQASVDVTDLEVDKIVNVVELSDTNKNTIERAFATTRLIFYKQWFPIVAR